MGQQWMSFSQARRLGNQLADYNNITITPSSCKKLMSHFLSDLLSHCGILPRCPAPLQTERLLLLLLMSFLIRVLKVKRTGKWPLTTTFKQTDTAENLLQLTESLASTFHTQPPLPRSLLLGNACMCLLSSLPSYLGLVNKTDSLHLVGTYLIWN